MILEVTVDPNKAAEHWPETTWHGFNVIDYVYPPAIDQIEGQFENDESISDFQEVYLGYIPKEDAFVIGWDIWSESDSDDDSYMMARFIKFTMNPNLQDQIYVIKSDFCLDRFYNTGYEKVHELYPNIVDLRLD